MYTQYVRSMWCYNSKKNHQSSYNYSNMKHLIVIAHCRIVQTSLPLFTVSSASMTRLRSRTTSSSSFSSFDGFRSRTQNNELQRGRTHSHTTDEKRGRSFTDVSMESISNSNVDQIISKSTEVAC